LKNTDSNAVKLDLGVLILSAMTEDSHRFYTESGLGTDIDWFATAMPFIPRRNFRRVWLLHEPIPTYVPEQVIIIPGSECSVHLMPRRNDLNKFIQTMWFSDKSCLFICFGHQALCDAFGGKVERNKTGLEFGQKKITLTEYGLSDPIFQGISSPFSTIVAHEDCVSVLPELPRPTLLAQSDNCTYQALSFGTRWKSFQFHPEMHGKIIEATAQINKESLLNEGVVNATTRLPEFIRNLGKASNEGRRIFENFIKHCVPHK